MSEFDHRRLDKIVHSRIRLAVMSILASVEDAEFTYLRDEVKTSDGNLSSHLQKLEGADYISVHRSFVRRTPVTRYRLTDSGREALSRYVDRLGEMIGGREVGDG